MDEHWCPSVYYCAVCAINYDYVVRYENLDTEMPFILKKLGLDEKVPDDRWNSPGRVCWNSPVKNDKFD